MRYPGLDQWELFDLKTDPREMDNLYGKKGYGEITAKLKTELKRLRKHYKEPEGKQYKKSQKK